MIDSKTCFKDPLSLEEDGDLRWSTAPPPDNILKALPKGTSWFWNFEHCFIKGVRKTQKSKISHTNSKCSIQVTPSWHPVCFSSVTHRLCLLPPWWSSALRAFLT